MTATQDTTTSTGRVARVTGPVVDVASARAFAATHGFPLIIKAAMGGGGRGNPA